MTFASSGQMIRMRYLSSILRTSSSARVTRATLTQLTIKDFKESKLLVTLHQEISMKDATILTQFLTMKVTISKFTLMQQSNSSRLYSMATMQPSLHMA